MREIAVVHKKPLMHDLFTKNRLATLSMILDGIGGIVAMRSNFTLPTLTFCRRLNPLIVRSINKVLTR